MSTGAAATFDEHVKGRNVMAPHRIECGYTSTGAVYELCQGEDFNRRQMYAVTVLVNGKLDTDLSALFNDGTPEQRHAAARRYITELGGGTDGV